MKPNFADIDKEIEFRTYDFLTSNDGDDEGLLRDVFYEDIDMFMNNTTADSGRDPLEVNVDHLKRLLSTVLTIPRNDQEDKVRGNYSYRHEAYYDPSVLETRDRAEDGGGRLHLRQARAVRPRHRGPDLPGQAGDGGSSRQQRDRDPARHQVSGVSGQWSGHHVMTLRWGTEEDRVLVVGAHWDTVPSSGGLDDNGSGV